MGEAAVTAKQYLNAPDNHLLIDNRSFGRRKYVQVTMNRQSSLAGSKGKAQGQHPWLHSEDSLLNGNISYNLKFLGRVEVEQPKGSAMVKDAIRKMKFNKQIRKAEGEKLLKVELVISVNGIKVEESRHKVVQYQYPLHRISYCADDKSDKRMFSFIAKEADSEIHNCFVFDSEKCAEAICLTVGQAFDLAYRRFKESGNNMLNKQHTLLQKKVQQLTRENLKLKEKVADLERLVDPTVLQNYKPASWEASIGVATKFDYSLSLSSDPVVGRKLENLVLDDDLISTANHSNGVMQPASPAMPVLAPPPPVPSRASFPLSPPQLQPAPQPSLDLFGSPPFEAAPAHARSGGQTVADDPFGMPAFSPAPHDLDLQIANGNKDLMEVQTGFSEGLSFGTYDFSHDSSSRDSSTTPHDDSCGQFD